MLGALTKSIISARPYLARACKIGETLGSSVGRSHGEPLAEQAQHNFLADTASGTGNDRNALLFAHRSPLGFQT